MWISLHDGARVWKGYDWDVMHRLHEQGFITDPHGKAKSVVLTEAGLARSRAVRGVPHRPRFRHRANLMDARLLVPSARDRQH